VHWARDAAEHNRIVHGILADHGAKSLIKSKSMLTRVRDQRRGAADHAGNVLDRRAGLAPATSGHDQPDEPVARRHLLVVSAPKLRSRHFAGAAAAAPGQSQG
jgi:L-lactate dehydrogenase complex protein LldF